MAIFAPLIAPYGPRERSAAAHGRVPTGRRADHWVGLDQQSRDEWSRIVYGARYSLVIGVVSVAVGLTIGLILGGDRRLLRREDRLRDHAAAWTSCSRSRACSWRSGSSPCSARACSRS